MVGPGENELRTDEKGMLMFTYKELPDNCPSLSLSHSAA